MCGSLRSRGDSCNSRLSWDSGCRSSSYYSSGSSQYYSDGSTHYHQQQQQQNSSTPINIPERNGNHGNRSESETSYYINHNSPQQFSETGSSISSAIEDNFESESLYDDPVCFPCFDKQSDSTLNEITANEDTQRRCLPDIVNPKKKMDVYQRHRSSQRSRRKSAKMFVNSAYISTPERNSPPHSLLQRSSSERFPSRFDEQELEKYDFLPTNKYQGPEKQELENYDFVPFNKIEELVKNEVIAVDDDREIYENSFVVMHHAEKVQRSESKLRNGQHSQKPRLTEEKPRLTEEKPRLTEEKPRLTEEKPRLTEEKPRLTEEKPRLTEEKPRLTEEKPRLTEEKPRLTEEQPQLTAEHPRLIEEEPRITKSNINGENTDRYKGKFSPTNFILSRCENSWFLSQVLKVLSSQTESKQIIFSIGEFIQT